MTRTGTIACYVVTYAFTLVGWSLLLTSTRRNLGTGIVGVVIILLTVALAWDAADRVRAARRAKGDGGDTFGADRP